MLEFDFDSPNIEIAEISDDKKYGRFSETYNACITSRSSSQPDKDRRCAS